MPDLQSGKAGASPARATNLTKGGYSLGEDVSPLAFVYVLERVRHEEMGWTGVIIEVDQGRGWIRVQWSRPGNILFNQDFYTELQFVTRFGWDGADGTWIVRSMR